MMRTLPFAGIALLIGGGLSGQTTEFSPYSRYGLGLFAPIPPTALMGIGGGSAAWWDGSTYNPDQPASGVSCANTTFQLSAVGTSLALSSSGGGSARARFGAPGPMSLVVKRPAGSRAWTLDLQPGSSTGYAITRTGSLEGVGKYSETYSGDGGLTWARFGYSQAFRRSGMLATAGADSVRVQKQVVFAGVRMNYLFGEQGRKAVLDIVDINFLDQINTVRAQHRSPGLEAGLLLDRLVAARYSASGELLNSLSVQFGGTFAPSAPVESDLMRLVTITQTFGGVPLAVDTALYTSSSSTGWRLPQVFSVGLGISRSTRSGGTVRAAVDVRRQDWSGSKTLQEAVLAPGVAWGVQESFRAGVEWVPGRGKGRTATWALAAWRIGCSEETSPFTVGGSPLTTRRISLGGTLPLARSRSTSRVSFGMEFGDRSTGTPESLKEQFATVSVGFQLQPFFKNLWLTPQLYD